MKRIADKRKLKGDEVVGDERNTTKTRLNISIGKNKNKKKILPGRMCTKVQVPEAPSAEQT